jgi:hypothetical protein
MNENTIGRETVANWMILRGYATGHGDTIQDLLFEMEGQLGGPKELPPGEGDFRILQQRVKDAEADAQRLHAEKMRLFEALLDISILPDVRCDEAPEMARRALDRQVGRIAA